MRIFIIFMLSIQVVLADDLLDKFHDPQKQAGKADNGLYQQNCGECHMAYQPAFLPQASWATMMQAEQLSEHFGDNARLAEADRQAIEAYLTQNSRQGKHQSLRITEQAFFRDEHKEIPAKYLKNNPVPLLSQCNVCHQKASDGLYEDDFVTLPNHGRWEDD
jgi:mono/diheme cytochrome c family protein